MLGLRPWEFGDMTLGEVQDMADAREGSADGERMFAACMVSALMASWGAEVKPFDLLGLEFEERVLRREKERGTPSV